MAAVMIADRVLIAIDDTDNLESRGTGYRARMLAQLLAQQGRAEIEGITRHQLMVSPLIPYTSHNSAACLAVRADMDRLGDLTAVCGEYLAAESAPGSDAGLCIAAERRVGDVVKRFGRRAKSEVLSQEEAVRLAAQENLVLRGYTGTEGGVIGALAAIGLRAGGEDGRFLWLRGIRDIDFGYYRVADLFDRTGVDRLQTTHGEPIVDLDQIVDVWWSPRPVLLQGQAVLLVEKADGDKNCTWRIAPKELVRQY